MKFKQKMKPNFLLCLTLRRKKIAIASIHKLIRTIYALIINDQPYDYNVATHNQKDFSRN
ncbi:hypothetical protein L2210_00010 [Lactobacillus crispatus]|uniref:hypothetical protein n=1 Tax=Lactobacillus crispatus TaxID=47770 RepID=UPI0022AE8FBD|nr:hypothetical protein [Lactobacillus crispatus]MCZ3989460.1 hypothetical protein [Lactobacillus crispatus]